MYPGLCGSHGMNLKNPIHKVNAFVSNSSGFPGSCRGLQLTTDKPAASIEVNPSKPYGLLLWNEPGRYAFWPDRGMALSLNRVNGKKPKRVHRLGEIKNHYRVKIWVVNPAHNIRHVFTLRRFF
jgi:hypothetical protein